MIESEFDKYVRDLLQNAEEEVSPRVWEGVAAGLAKKRRVVPVWGWAAASLAAAAAVVAAVVVFRSNPTISSLETPEVTASVQEILPVSEEEAPVSVLLQEEKPVAVKAVAAVRTRIAAIPSALLPSGKVSGKPQQPVHRVQKPVVPDTERLALVEDHVSFNQMLFDQRKKEDKRGFSLLATGNLQGNQRGKVNTAFSQRPYAAPSANAAVGIYNEEPETNFRMPFSIGLGLRYNFTNRWALGTGLRYTNLGRTFVGDYKGSDFTAGGAVIDNQQHWVGIPLNLYYDMVNKGAWRVHTFIGGTGEYLALDDYVVHSMNLTQDQHYTKHCHSIQWSVGAGIGVDFKLSPHINLFLDPSFRYYFRDEEIISKHRSLRTIQPLRFDIEVGVRFTFKEQ